MAHTRLSAFLSGEERSGKLVIFDKDGTLIDFNAMWAGWMTTLARRLEAATYVSVAPQLYVRVGFDPASGTIDASGPLAIATMAELRAHAVAALCAVGLAPAAAEAGVAQAWYIPDPVALAQPLADLPALFAALRAHGVRITIATTDDRAATQATLESLGVAQLVDALACGDDGHAIKPAPDAVLKLCAQFSLTPANAIVIGDTTADLRMARAAGARLAVGVLSGVGTRAVLAPLADVLLPSVGELLTN